MATRKMLTDAEASPEARAVFDDIRAKRKTDFVNNAWRALAHDPETLKATWEKAQRVMGPGTLDPLTKELVYLAVSISNKCEYCIHSHTAFAKAKGLTETQYNEFLRVIALANELNATMTAIGTPVDEVFKA
ncbi:MAG TPA: carboxymuconolactone decarboxylase family protein [Hyphomicrobiaceae bacterium]|nr:carboxymuconolactone decarboxylase family protein [Hyphomicrobiaceae bacterium]